MLHTWLSSHCYTIRCQIYASTHHFANFFPAYLLLFPKFPDFILQSISMTFYIRKSKCHCRSLKSVLLIKILIYSYTRQQKSMPILGKEKLNNLLFVHELSWELIKKWSQSIHCTNLTCMKYIGKWKVGTFGTVLCTYTTIKNYFICIII